MQIANHHNYSEETWMNRKRDTINGIIYMYGTGRKWTWELVPKWECNVQLKECIEALIFCVYDLLNVRIIQLSIKKFDENKSNHFYLFIFSQNYWSTLLSIGLIKRRYIYVYNILKEFFKINWDSNYPLKSVRVASVL